MVLMDWSDTYSVGNARLDEQHKQLFCLINNLHDSMHTGKGQAVINEVLEQLASYTSVHFADEERMMQLARYPNLAKHRRIHEAFVAQVRGFQEQTTGRSFSLTREVMAALKDWLINHIKVEDQAYASALAERAA